MNQRRSQDFFSREALGGESPFCRGAQEAVLFCFVFVSGVFEGGTSPHGYATDMNLPTVVLKNWYLKHYGDFFFFKQLLIGSYLKQPHEFFNNYSNSAHNKFYPQNSLTSKKKNIHQKRGAPIRHCLLYVWNKLKHTHQHTHTHIQCVSKKHYTFEKFVTITFQNV